MSDTGYNHYTFDRYEAALILDACEQFLIETGKSRQIVSTLSDELCTYSKRQGRQFDNTVQQKTGIIYQMLKMIYVVTDGAKGESGAPHVFYEIYNLKKNKEYEYKRILDTAKGKDTNIENDGTINDIESYEEEFFEWLNNRVSTVQVKELKQCYLALDEYCYSKKILSKHIFEVPDNNIIPVLRSVIYRDKGFDKYQIRSSLLMTAIWYLSNFLSTEKINTDVQKGSESSSTNDVLSEKRNDQISPSKEDIIKSEYNSNSQIVQTTFKDSTVMEGVGSDNKIHDTVEPIEIKKNDSTVESFEVTRIFPSIDRTEAIYLIDTYIDTVTHKGDLGEVAKEVSRVFRARAQQFDIVFDETFRNVHFVDECFADIAKLFQNPDNDNCHPLLKELINLRLKDLERYNIQSKIVFEELTRLGILSTENTDVVNQQDKGVTQPEPEKSNTSNLEKIDAGVISQEESAQNLDSDNNLGNVQSIIVPTPSMDDGAYLSDMLYVILKTESARNQYGTTLYYLSSLAKVSQEKVKAILEHSEWAAYRYGKYRFVETADESEMQYDFANPQSLAYTRPIRLLYFDDVISEATTWRQLYIDFMRALYEDYPDTIREIIGEIYPPSSSPLVDNATEIKRYRVPGEFAPGLITELNRSASNIVNCIEKLLELCNVDYENVRIFFMRKQTSVVEQPAPSTEKDTGGKIAEKVDIPRQPVPETTERRYLQDDKEDFYRWLIDDFKISKETSAGYITAIRVAEDYACKSISSACKLFCDNNEIIEFTASALFIDEVFKKKNKQQHNCYFEALRLYLKFKHITVNDSVELAHTIIEPITEEPVDISGNVLATLQEHFVYGFNISSPIELMRFRANYEADHNEQCTFDDEALMTVISSCGLAYNGKIYVVEQGIKDRIRSLVMDRVQSGDIIFYYEEIYSINEDWLFDGHVIDSEMLKVLLENILPEYQYKDRFFIVCNTRISEINALNEAILRVWGDQILHNFAELKELLPYIPFDKIRHALSCSKEFTWNSLETYARNDLFVVSDEQIQKLVSVVEEKCTGEGSVSFDELPIEEIAAENYDLSETALFDIIFAYLPESFSRNGRVISKNTGQQHDTVAAIQQYCKNHETCTMTELQQIMQDVEGSVRNSVIIEAASSVMVRVSQDDFVADTSVIFDVTDIDSALDSVVVGNGIGIKEVITFGAFPFCGYSWNHFVLESYCRRFSAKYRYACITPNSQNAGAIIRKKSDLSYHDIMAEALARSDVKLVREDVFDYLISSGYMIRRQYSDMEELLKKAAALREGSD